jgi:hypothetical protein
MVFQADEDGATYHDGSCQVPAFIVTDIREPTPQAARGSKMSSSRGMVRLAGLLTATFDIVPEK